MAAAAVYLVGAVTHKVSMPAGLWVITGLCVPDDVLTVVIVTSRMGRLGHEAPRQAENRT
jgi:hypothetical protein